MPPVKLGFLWNRAKNGTPLQEDFTRIHEAAPFRKKNKTHTYKLHAVRKGCTQSHKIRTQVQRTLTPAWTLYCRHVATYDVEHTLEYLRKPCMCCGNAFLATSREEFHSEYLAVKTSRC
ncbi:unnamed protein product [Leptosia nina]|uniref:Uncharacterized protein n=1 Tax=Leptosia nina TaxID=320188 RepID=A0AAV1JC16_9NEOP